MAGRIRCFLLTAGLAAQCAVPALAQPPDLAVVLFDQSVSERRLEPKLAAAAMEAVSHLAGVHALTIGGFDEEVSWYVRAERPASAPARKARDRLRRMALHERNADFEPVFRHLAETVDPARVKVAVIISHGAPQVWDQRLSPMIKADSRYQDYNDQYRDLLGAQATKVELHDYLGPFYQERNARLTDAALPRLRQTLGPRLIVWDISGHSAALKAWSAAAEARYLPLAASGAGLPAKLKEMLAAEQRPPQVAVARPAPAKAIPTAKPAQTDKIPPRPWERAAPVDHAPRPPPGKPAPRDRVVVSDLAAPKAVAAAPPPPVAAAAAAEAPPAPASPFSDLAALAAALGLLAAAWWWRHRDSAGKES